MFGLALEFLNNTLRCCKTSSKVVEHLYNFFWGRHCTSLKMWSSFRCTCSPQSSISCLRKNPQGRTWKLEKKGVDIMFCISMYYGLCIAVAVLVDAGRESFSLVLARIIVWEFRTVSAPENFFKCPFVEWNFVILNRKSFQPGNWNRKAYLSENRSKGKK